MSTGRFRRLTALTSALLMSGTVFAQGRQVEQSAEAKQKASAYYHFALGHLYAELARSYRSQEDFDRAVENYRKAIEADPHASFLVEELTDLFLQANKWRDAVREAEDLLKTNPDNLQARRILGRIYSRLITGASGGKQQTDLIRLALEQYKILTEKDPTEAEGWVRLGWLQRVSNNSLEAESAFKKALELDKNNEEALNELARLYTDLKENSRAIETLNRVEEPSLSTLLFLAGLYEEQRDYDQAAKTYQKAIEEAPENPQIRGALAQTLLLAHKFDEARGVYLQLLQENPDNAQLHLRISQIYAQERNFEAARQSLEKAKALEPDNPEVMLHEVALLEAEDKVPQAIQTLEKLIASSEKATYTDAQKAVRAQLLERLAFLYRSANKTDEAVAAFRKLGELDEGLGPRVAAQIIETYRGAKQFDKAMSEADAAAGKYSGNRMVRTIRASLLADVGRGAEAVADLKKMLGGDSDREVYLSIAQIYEKDKDYGPMAGALDNAWGLSSTDDQKETILFMRGVMYEKNKDFEKSEAQFQQILKMNPDNASALNYLGYTLADRNIRLPEALRYIEKALELDPGNGAYLDSLGWVNYRLNRFDEAERLLQRALAKIDGDPVVYDHLGDVYYSQGRLKDAITQWEASLEEWKSAAKSEEDPAGVASVQRKLEGAKVRLAKEGNGTGKP